MTAPVVEPKPEYLQYAWLSLLALFGSIARAGRWTDDKGKFLPSKFFTEIPTAIVLGVMAESFAVYMNWKPEIAGGLSGAAGLIGAPGVLGIVNNMISSRFGGKRDASDPKPS